MPDSRSETKMNQEQAIMAADENNHRQPEGVFENQPHRPGTIGRAGRRIFEAVGRMAGKGHRRAASLIVIAASLLLAGPANAQDAVEIWSATLNAKALVGSSVGCSNSSSSGKRCNESSVLSDDDFSLRSTDRVVEGISVTGRNPANLSVTVSPGSGSSAFQKVTLHVGSTSLTFADATHSTFGSNAVFRWTMTGLSWSDGDSIALRMTEDQAPTRELVLVDRTGLAVSIRYIESLSGTVIPTTESFSVTVDGEEREVTRVQGIIGTRDMLIVIYPGAARGETVRVSYRDLTSGNDATGVIEDRDGNDAASFTNVLTTNRSTAERPKFTPSSSGRYNCFMEENLSLEASYAGATSERLGT